MRILVTFAVDAEFAPWRKLREFQKIERNDMECFSANVDGAEINVLLTGIGGKKAWVEAAKVIWDCDVDFCISSGLAGGLRPQHLAGEILVPGEILDSASRSVACDEQLIQLAVKSSAKRVDAFYTGSDVVGHAADKKQLGLIADAVEMESLEVLEEATGFGAKVVAVRGISDTVEENLPLDFNRVTTRDGDVSMMKVFGQIAQHPWSIPSLLRFGKQSRMAAGKLAGFLDRYVVSIVENAKMESAAGVKVG